MAASGKTSVPVPTPTKSQVACASFGGGRGLPALLRAMKQELREQEFQLRCRSSCGAGSGAALGAAWLSPLCWRQSPGVLC